MARVSPLGSGESPPPGAAQQLSALEPDTTWKELLDDREILRLDVGDSSQAFERPLPGVTEERRFHRLYPDVLLSNTLLRQFLREDYHEQYNDAKVKESRCEDLIVLGHARGGHSHLHQAIGIVSSAQPNTLHAALMQPEGLTAQEHAASHSGRIFSSNPGSRGDYRFQHPILSVYACVGKPSSTFVVRTRQGVYCLDLRFHGSLRDAVLEISMTMEIPAETLQGGRAMSALLVNTDRMILYVLCSLGYLHTREVDQDRLMKHKHANNRFNSCIPLGHNDQQMIDLLYSGTLLKRFLVVSIGKVVITEANFIARQIIFKTYDGEQIVSARTVDFDPPTSSFALCILTTQRLVILKVSEQYDVATADWRHNLSLALLPVLQVVALKSRIFASVQIPRSGLIIIYQTDFGGGDDVFRTQFRLRLSGFDGHSSGAYFYSPYTDSASSANIWGVFYLRHHSALVSTIVGSPDLTVERKRAMAQSLTPAIISESNSMIGDQAPRNIQSQLDLSTYYQKVLRTMSHAAPGRQCRDPELQTLQDNQLYLAHEVLDLEESHMDDFDDSMESALAKYMDGKGSISETPGLKLHDDLLDSSEPDATTASRLHQRLAPWNGKRGSTYSGPLDEQSQQTAQSLALSMVCLSTLSMHSDVLNRLRITSDRGGRTTSRAITALLDKWRVGEDPALYDATQAVANHEKQPLKQYIPPEIPAFKMLAPPVVSSTQAPTSASALASSQDDYVLPATQPVQGKFADRKVKKKRMAGFR